VETRAGIVKAHYGWLKAAGGANAAIEMGSLPRILRNRIEDFPQRDRYLVPDSDEPDAGVRLSNICAAADRCLLAQRQYGRTSRAAIRPLDAWADSCANCRHHRLGAIRCARRRNRRASCD